MPLNQSLAQRYTLRSSGPLKERVYVAMVRTAQDVAGSATPTAPRKNLANAVLNDPARFIDRWMDGIAATDEVDESSSDAQIKTQCDNVFTFIANTGS